MIKPIKQTICQIKTINFIAVFGLLLIACGHQPGIGPGFIETPLLSRGKTFPWRVASTLIHREPKDPFSRFHPAECTPCAVPFHSTHSESVP